MKNWDTTDPFAEARRERGVLPVDFLGERIPLILAYDTVKAAAWEPETFSSNAPFRVPIPEESGVRKVRQVPIETDPPEHSAYRAIVQPVFNQPRDPAMIEKIEALVAETLAGFAGGEPFEVIHELALPLQTQALTLLLGVPMIEAKEWEAWGTNVFYGDETVPGEKGERLDGYLHRKFDEAEASPGADFFSRLVTAEYEGRKLTRDELMGYGLLTFAGGRDTVISMLAFTLNYFAENPAALGRIREDGSLVRRAVEEFVRVASPLSHIARVCPHATDVQGEPVEADHRVSLCWASANRDASVFEAPDEIRIDRKPNRHFGFGWGPHNCLGSAHARLILRSVISWLVAHDARLEVLEHVPHWEDWHTYRRQIGYERITMRLETNA